MSWRRVPFASNVTRAVVVLVAAVAEPVAAVAGSAADRRVLFGKRTT